MYNCFFFCDPPSPTKTETKKRVLNVTLKIEEL